MLINKCGLTTSNKPVTTEVVPAIMSASDRAVPPHKKGPHISGEKYDTKRRKMPIHIKIEPPNLRALKIFESVKIILLQKLFSCPTNAGEKIRRSPIANTIMLNSIKKAVMIK
jgi:hypothetical protein